VGLEPVLVIDDELRGFRRFRWRRRTMVRSASDPKIIAVVVLVRL
jgi:hypothetical protein